MRYNLRTGGRTLIYPVEPFICNLTEERKGVRSGPPKVLSALLVGEQVDPHRYDFHMHVFLETGDER